MRLTLVIGTFGAGGAERVMAMMASYWVAQGHDITLVTLSPESDDWFELDRRVHRVGLDLLSVSTGIGQAIYHNVRRIIRLRQQFRRSQPNIVISFLDTTNILTLLASLGLGIPIIVSERINPEHHALGGGWRGLRSVLYRHAGAVVVQSRTVGEWACRIVATKKIYVIPNPIKPLPISGRANVLNQRVGNTIIAMGRLVRQKGFDILIEAFGRCAAKHPGWSLVILGDGEERLNLQALAADLGIGDRIYFAGKVREPDKMLREADLFVLSSRYEGFPNALLEAMASGLAAISADCPSGPNEIIRDGVNGVLVRPDDVEALAAAMDGLMTDPLERQRLGVQAMEVVERFGINHVMKIWDELLKQLSRERVPNLKRLASLL